MTDSKAKKSSKRILWEYTEAIVTALLLALLIRAFVIQAFKIPSGSMIPTLHIGDYILVNKFIYGVKIPFKKEKVLVWQTPKRGDIIVFRYPKDPDRDFIKRVIGVEGDMIEEKDKQIYINGELIEEDYAEHLDDRVIPPTEDRRDNFGPLTVPKDRLFVLGDNRDNSHDSRWWGFVNANEIRGKAMIIYWSWNGEKKLPRLGRMGKLVHSQ